VQKLALESTQLIFSALTNHRISPEPGIIKQISGLIVATADVLEKPAIKLRVYVLLMSGNQWFEMTNRFSKNKYLASLALEALSAQLFADLFFSSMVKCRNSLKSAMELFELDARKEAQTDAATKNLVAHEVRCRLNRLFV